jgi:hypothetical protein
MSQRNAKPGLAKTSPKAATAHDAVVKLLAEFCRDHRISDRDLQVILETTKSRAEGRLDGSYNFLVRDIVMMPDREALDCLDRLRDFIRARRASNHG